MYFPPSLVTQNGNFNSENTKIEETERLSVVSRRAPFQISDMRLPRMPHSLRRWGFRGQLISGASFHLVIPGSVTYESLGAFLRKWMDISDTRTRQRRARAVSGGPPMGGEDLFVAPIIVAIFINR